MQQILYDFVEQFTANFDKSHDIHHAIKVFNNAIKIINSMEIEYETDVITWTSMLHDICDHKYNKDELFKFIKLNLGEFKANRIMAIIHNEERITLPYPDYIYLDVISDAYLLEVLGIKRCKHCHEELLKLFPDYFKTSLGKELALPLHQELVEYINTLKD